MTLRAWKNGQTVIIVGTSWIVLAGMVGLSSCSGRGSTNGANVSPDGSSGAGNASGSAASGSGGAGGNGGAVTSASGTGAGSTSAASGGSGGMAGCNCSASQVCDPDTNMCVDCLPANDTCIKGKYCDAKTKTCVSGCAGDKGCTPPQKCDVKLHACVDCLTSVECAANTYCSDGKCVAGCQNSMNCSGTDTCCAMLCIDTQASLQNCGKCGNACVAAANAKVNCDKGKCAFAGCEAGWDDCNLDLKDGCEHDLAAGACKCKPGATKACYNGRANTLNVGICKGGTSTCDSSGIKWGKCAGEVLPLPEVCGDNVDDDCSGKLDDPPDIDGDGWNYCQGDCCDEVTLTCSSPKLVNPGAFEIGGNNTDDDCDGKVDNVLGACDAALASNSAVAADYAKAIDICQTTADVVPLPQKKWGLISASFFLANGAGTPNASSRSIRGGYGSGVKPFTGSSLAVLSSGTAAAQKAPYNTNPNWASFQPGSSMGTTSAAPSDWLAANGNKFPNAPGCPAPATGNVNDPVMLKLRIRVPTNAKSFAVSSFFYSAEFPDYVCSPFNDFFLELLDSTFVPAAMQQPNPTDKNLAVYINGNKTYPVGVNLAFGNTGLFTQCINGPTGCTPGSVPGTINTCKNTTQLAGTGFDIINDDCQPGDMLGGGTGWLTTDGNVVPGETMEIRFVIWDTSDHFWDSLVLLDNFQWSVDVAVPGTHG